MTKVLKYLAPLIDVASGIDDIVNGVAGAAVTLLPTIKKIKLKIVISRA